jgi:cysteine desulfurase
LDRWLSFCSGIDRMIPIYLDNHATTRVDPRVLEVMDPWLRHEYGNPASRSHRYGWKAEEAVESARIQVAVLVGAKPSEIVFTAGATESNNTVLKGTTSGIVTTVVEHKSVLAPCAWIGVNFPRRIAFAGVDGTGTVDLEEIVGKVDSRTGLVSVMMANNEVGSIQPVDKVARLVSGVLVHSDMAQAVGKIPIDLETLGIHFASFSAHKMYGPKGIGALYIRDDVAHLLTPLTHGGGQERGIRSGTLNVPAIVGFGRTCEIAKAEMVAEAVRIGSLRDSLQASIVDAFPGSVVHGGSNRLPGNLNISLPCRDMNAFMAFVSDEVSLSFGSACMSNTGRSHVLEAMNVEEDEARRAIRIGLGRFTTGDEISKAANAIIRAIDIANKQA